MPSASTNFMKSSNQKQTIPNEMNLRNLNVNEKENNRLSVEVFVVSEVGGAKATAKSPLHWSKTPQLETNVFPLEEEMKIDVNQGHNVRYTYQSYL